MRKLWRHQEEGIAYLLDSGARKKLIVLPTGSGKSYIQQAASYLAVVEGALPPITHAVILTPNSNGVYSFCRPDEVSFQFGPRKRTIRYRDQFFAPIDGSESGTANLLAYLKTPSPRRIAVATHSLAVRLLTEPDLLGPHILIITDEVHHDGENTTQVSRLNEQVIEKGGTVWGLTACAARADEAPVFAGVEPYTVPYSRLAAQPELGFPTRFELRCFPLTTTRRRQGTSEEREEQDRYDNELIAKYLAAASLPSVVHVPLTSEVDGRGRAFESANEIATDLVALGVPEAQVFNVVTDIYSPNDAAIREGLLAEQKRIRNGGYPEAQYRYVIGCQRVRESLDWPIGCHVAFKGLGTSETTFVQQVGRILRSKKGLKGYPAEWQDLARITVFVPQDGLVALDQRRVFTHLACYLEGMRRAVLISHLWEELVDHMRVPPVWRSKVANGKGPLGTIEGQKEFERIRATLEKRGTELTVLSFAQEARKDAPLEFVQTLLAEVPDPGKPLKGREERWAAKLFEQIQEVQGATVQEVEDKFKEAVLSVLSDPTLCPTRPIREARTFSGYESTFSPRDMARIVADLQTEFDPFVAELSDDAWIVKNILRPYFRETGRPPLPYGDNVQDVSAWAGFRLTLSQIDQVQREKGFSLAALWQAADWIEGETLDGDIVQKVKSVLNRATAVRLLGGDWSPERYLKSLHTPELRQVDAKLVKVMKRKESLVGLELAHRRGWRGVREGTSLLDLW